MRKIKAYFFISLDGVVEAPDKWHFPWFDDDMGAAIGAAFEGTDALLMGRAQYSEWAVYWPAHPEEEFGHVLNAMQKYVVSNSLASADWENTELIPGTEAAARIADLKATDGGDIAMNGSATTVRWLLGERLLDELHLLVHPVAVGQGHARLFDADGPERPLDLLSSQAFGSGVLNLAYAPR